MKQIAVMGFGVVGSGVVEVLYKNKESITRRAGEEIDVKYILDLRKFPDSPYHNKIIEDFSEILQDDTIHTVVEVMGGINPAYDFVSQCLTRGKNVVTSNKELVAQKGFELLTLAKENNVNFFFEASVGGGIPIITPLHQCLAANEIDEIAGILNGTTNFILTKMINEAMPFDEALTLAKKLGYAESNPSADIDGHDAVRKICILASLAFGYHVYPSKVHTEGIIGITSYDVEYAKDWGGVIKLIGYAKRWGDKISAMVSPAFVGNESQLSGINDVFNGILIKGDVTGDVVFYGKGAGKLPTASAVVADVIDCIKANGSVKSLYWNEAKDDYVIDYKTIYTSFYVRVDSVSSEYDINKIFGDVRFLDRKNKPINEVAFISQSMPEGEFDIKIAELSAANVDILSKIRILEVGND